ncbi:hypothetical protein ACRQ4C_13415 [Curtobacterium sp. SP.BCp]|uniref:hypothetical protein n=1 Tax=Curtobacterium sp. SP.BCp TaxID=3435230 RepID=UPI003F73E64B
MTIVRPPRWQRGLDAIVMGPLTIIVGGAVASVAFVPEASAKGFVFVLGSAFVVLGACGLIRVRHVGVHLSEDTLSYRGYVLSWQAPRAGITAVLDDAFVEWRDGRGGEHRRQMWLLTQAWEDDGTKFAPQWRWRREGLLAVREWAGARAV